MAPDNPFSMVHVEREIAAWGAPPEADVGNVRLRWLEGDTIATTPEYLHWPLHRPPLRYPVLYVHDKIWMSLPPLEVQSVYVPIKAARGVVGTAGLGLGYFPLRAAAKKTVRRVDVYEIEEDVIRWFLGAFAGRPELEKICIIHGDVRAEMAGKRYDVVWMDPYDMLIDPHAAADARHFRACNEIREYRFWGLERLVVDAHMMGEVIPELTIHERSFLHRFQHTRMDTFLRWRLRDLWTPHTHPQQQRTLLEAIGRPWQAGPEFSAASLSRFQLETMERWLNSQSQPARGEETRAVNQDQAYPVTTVVGPGAVG